MSDTPRKPSLNKLSLKREATSEQFKLEERLHKVLAQAGLGSRRALEQRIAEGLVKVNGEVAQTGMSVKSGDKIELDGRGFVATALAEPSRVLVYNKPEGEVTCPRWSHGCIGARGRPSLSACSTERGAPGANRKASPHWRSATTSGNSARPRSVSTYS